jgi:outer membrane protein assembly factor BamB
MPAIRAHDPIRLHRLAFVGSLLAILLCPGLGEPVSAQGRNPGDQLWATRLSSPGDHADQASSLDTSPDGTVVFVTGRLAGQSPDASDYGTAAYDATTGTQLWARRFDGGNFGAGSELAVSPNGAMVFVTGDASDGYGTVAYDATSGATMWVSHIPAGSGQANDLALSPDGAMVFVTGWSAGGHTGYDYFTVALDAGTGRQVWAQPYDSHMGNDFESDLAVSPDGARVFVTGISPEPLGDDDYATVAYDAVTGTQLWVGRMSVPHRDDVAQAVAVSLDGTRVFVTGYTEGGFVTVAYDAGTGAQQWARRDARGLYAYALGVSPDGSRVFVAGTDGLRYVTVAYDAATGAPVWVNKDSTGEAASSLDVAADGATVYVTGRGSADGYATVAYDAGTGAQQWATLYNGPGGNDWTSDLAISADGASVFVTGESAGVGADFDYATVAYET